MEDSTSKKDRLACTTTLHAFTAERRARSIAPRKVWKARHKRFLEQFCARLTHPSSWRIVVTIVDEIFDLDLIITEGYFLQYEGVNYPGFVELVYHLIDSGRLTTCIEKPLTLECAVQGPLFRLHWKYSDDKIYSDAQKLGKSTRGSEFLPVDAMQDSDTSPADVDAVQDIPLVQAPPVQEHPVQGAPDPMPSLVPSAMPATVPHARELPRPVPSPLSNTSLIREPVHIQLDQLQAAIAQAIPHFKELRSGQKREFDTAQGAYHDARRPCTQAVDELSQTIDNLNQQIASANRQLEAATHQLNATKQEIETIDTNWYTTADKLRRRHLLEQRAVIEPVQTICNDSQAFLHSIADDAQSQNEYSRQLALADMSFNEQARRARALRGTT